MKKTESLAKKIRDMGGVCMFMPSPRHEVLLESSDEGVEVSLDVYTEATDDEPADSRAERFDSIEAALEGFLIDGKPLCECGGEPTAPFVPA